jgi:hypothetical protein
MAAAYIVYIAKKKKCLYTYNYNKIVTLNIDNLCIYFLCICGRESCIYVCKLSRVFEDNACRPYRRHARRVIRGNAVSATTHSEQRRDVIAY